MTTTTTTLDLVGVYEIAQRAGVTKGLVHKWRERHPDSFPAPVAELAAGPVWQWQQIEQWLAATGRAARTGSASSS